MLDGAHLGGSHRWSRRESEVIEIVEVMEIIAVVVEVVDINEILEPVDCFRSSGENRGTRLAQERLYHDWSEEARQSTVLR